MPKLQGDGPIFPLEQKQAPEPDYQEPQPQPSRFRQYGRFSGRTALAGILLAAGGSVVLHEPSHADSTQAVAEATVPHTVYRTGGDGVWLHESPGLNTPLKVVMPEGATFQVDCFVTGGDNVNGNRLWLQGEYNGQTGAVTDYYIDTHWNTTQDLVNQGIEECGTAQAQAPEQAERPYAPPEEVNLSRGGSVFYAPGDGGVVEEYGSFGSVADYTMGSELEGKVNSQQELEERDWSIGNCAPNRADNFPKVIGSEIVTTLGGWSIGRLGPAYFLQETAKPETSEESKQKRDNVDYIVLFDPGSKANYGNDCDQQANQSQEMAKWLGESPDNHLVIFAGAATTDTEHPNDGYYHQGIQETLFAPAIRGQSNIADQVVICNYDDMGHEDTYSNFKEYMNKPPITDPAQCPGNVVGWRP